MYYVNKEQIHIRLVYLAKVEQTLRILIEQVQAEGLIHQFALERALHVAAESVTDIGSYMIDGFVMRDASSYEDIVDILFGEGVFPQEVYDVISPLVKMRKPLVQSYYELNQDDLIVLAEKLPDGLKGFAASVVHYLSKELMES